MSVLVAGGTGWIGSSLLPKLQSPLVVSRNKLRAVDQTGLRAEQIIQCDINQSTLPASRLKSVDHVINLVGESIADGRWTEEKKRRIRDSRVDGTARLVQSFLDSGELPKTYVAASAIGYYGDRGDEILDESSKPGDDFLARTCVEWEEAAQPLIDAGVRVCFVRIGLVLGRGGGAMAKMLPLFRLGVGGRLGSGKQWMSWIHREDLTRLIVHLIEHESAQGPFNGTTPNPVRNHDFTKSLGKAVHRPTILPAPRFGLKIILGEFGDSLLASQRVLPRATEQTGFEYKFPELPTAFKEIVD